MSRCNLYTVYVQIFEGRKFCCFRSQSIIRKIFILKILTKTFWLALIEELQDIHVTVTATR